MGKYRLETVLGSGNFATVVKARHMAMGRDVALKLLKPEVVDAHPEVAQRFLSEVKIVSRLSHPNTVTIYDFGRMPEGILYMCLEYVDGQTLDSLVDGKRLPITRASKIVRQVLKSLDEAHGMGIIHRDLKPGNIMVSDRHGESDVVKVLDFGVAKLVGDDDEVRATRAPVRRSTQFIGTPIYMSPEQVLGQHVTPASDIYSLGLILYEMLTGDPPIDDKLNVAGVAQIHVDEAPIPFKYIDRLPAEWADVILKATCRQPEDRFQSVREFARALPAEASSEATGEFAKLIAASSDEIPVSDHFDQRSSGSFEIPSDETPSREARRVPTPKRAEELAPSRDAQKFGPDLALDIGKVKRAETAVRRKSPRPESAPRPVATAVSGADVGWLVGGVLALVMLWHLSGAFVGSEGHTSRVFVGVILPALAAFFAYFSDVRNIHGGFVQRFAVPIMRYQVRTLLLLVLAAAFGFPGHAAASLADHSDWPAQVGLPWVELWGPVLRELFMVTSDLLPW